MHATIAVIGNYNDEQASRPEAEIFISLAQRGYSIFMLTDENTEYAKRFRAAGITVIHFRAAKKFDSANIQFIRSILINEKIDILHIFSPKAMVNAIQAAKNIPVKVIVYRGYTGNSHWWDLTLYFKHLSPRVDAITCLTDATRDLIRKNLFFRKDRAITIMKGHLPEWYANVTPASLAEFNLPAGAFVISCTANVRPMKGVRYLIKATRYLSLNSPVHFILIGNGFDKPEFLKKIRTSPMAQHFHIAGFRRDAMNIVKACNASVLPSIYGEATPKAVIESMYLGIPPIITDIPGNKGMVVSGESGFIVSKANAKELAHAIEQISQNTEVAQKMGIAAKAHIEKFLNHHQTVDAVDSLYKKLLDQ